MKIALDYNSALRQIAGIGRLTRELVLAFLRLGGGDELLLVYAARDLPPNHAGLAAMRALVSEYPNVRPVPIPLAERWLTIAWQRARLPLPIERWTGAVDLVHGPDFVLPPVRRTPTLLTVHDLTFRVHPETAHAALRRYLESAVPRSLRRAHHILADSSSTRSDLQRFMGVDGERVSVLYPGVDPRFRRVSASDELERVRVRYALPERYFFFVSTLEPRKNLERLFTAYSLALHQLGASPDELQLLLGGRPGWLAQPILAAAARTLGVRLLGPLDDADLAALYTLATATVYPSLYEGFGFPPLESLACGTPVLAANTSSLPEVVGDVGLLVDPSDTHAIAAGLVRLAAEPALAADARERGPRRAARFSWPRAAEQLRDTYHRVARGYDER